MSHRQDASSLFPADMLLTPISRNPIRLADDTFETVLDRAVTYYPAGRITENPLVSIAVVTCNGLVFNRMCVESVLAHTDWPSFELLVVDNGSTDGTPEYLERVAVLHPHVRVWRNASNLGFAAATNRALYEAVGEILVLLNSDTIVPQGWLGDLQRHLRDPSVGLVGPVTNRIGNEAEIETSYTTFGELESFAAGRRQEAHPRPFDIRTAAMFCTALRRDTYERVGPLDEQFGIGMFEDDDYAMRVRQAGLRVVCTDDVFVHHFGQASFGNLAPLGEYGRLFHQNRRLWEAKWNVEWRPYERRPSESYAQHVRRVRDAAARVIPAGAIVLVASRGDEALLELGERTACHFPQGNNGDYAGHHPASSQAAIEQAEALAARGARYLIVPASVSWWLAHYTEFRDELEHTGRPIWSDSDCTIYQLPRSSRLTNKRPLETCHEAR